MHIAIVANEHPLFPTKGSSVVFTELTHFLLDAGHEVTFFLLEWRLNAKYTPEDLERELIALGPDRRARLRVIPFTYRPPQWMRWRPGTMWQRWKLRNFILAKHRELKFDLLECGDGYGFFPFGLGKELYLVLSLNGNTLLFDTELKNNKGDTNMHWLERQTVLHADHLVGISHYSLNRTLETNFIPPGQPGTMIYLGVDTARYHPQPEIPVEPGLILYINSIENRKGTRELIQAMPEVVAAHPEARLVLIGSISGRIVFTDEDREKLLAGIPEEVRRHITLMGWVDQKSKLEWLARAYISIYPSKLETFGIAPVEAMMMGRPVVYSIHGSGPEIIEHMKSGLLCDPYEPGNIARQLNTLLADPELAKQLAQAGYERAMALFTRDIWAKTQLAFFEEICRTKKK